MIRAHKGCYTMVRARTFLPDLLPSFPRDFRRYAQRPRQPRSQRPTPSRQDRLAELCQRLTRETFSPLTVLVDRAHECLHCSGPTEHYLQVPEGAPTRNLLAMARPALRAGLENGLRQAWSQNRPLTIEGGAGSLRIHLLPTRLENEELMLVCFIQGPSPDSGSPARLPPTPDRAAPLVVPVVALFPVASLLLRPASSIARPVIFLVDHDGEERRALRTVLEQESYLVEDFTSAETFLALHRPAQEACLLIDPDLPGMTGLGLLHHLKETGRPLPTIMISGKSDMAMAVQSMKSGARDFLAKPLDRPRLLAAIRQAMETSRDQTKVSAGRDDAASRIAGLTPRQHQIMRLVLAGHPNKNIAADLDISQRTVEHHRASIMEKTGSKSLPALARLALAAI